MNASDYVYFNLHKKVFSIKLRGKVREHTDWAIVLPNAEKVEFVVSEAGRQRVLRTGKKNVHAQVQGWLVEDLQLGGSLAQPVSYNPFKGPRFVTEGTPVEGASALTLYAEDGRGRIRASGLW